MEYYQMKLIKFTLFLREKDAELEQRVHELAVNQDGMLSSISGDKSSDEDWEKTTKLWDEFQMD
jgi:hypothetical protein